jgi:DNA modification methylase
VTAVVLRGDARRLPLPDGCVDLIVTSPPYFGLRSYTDDGAHYDGQIGSEASPREWLAALVACTREWVRVLKPSGSIFVNLGDKYGGGNSGDRQHLAELGARLGTGGGHKSSGMERKRLPATAPKSLLGLPWRYALACTDELGLILRRDIIWSKPNGLPESVTDRCRSSHEYLFHLVRQPRYYAAVDEIREPHARLWDSAKANGRTGRGRGVGAMLARPDNPNGGMATTEPNPLGKLPGSVWDIPSQPLVVPAALGVDHFAAFPMELPRRCILGWSPPGVCTACGEGRRPVSERTSARRHNNGTHGPTGLVPDDVAVSGSGRHGKGASTLDIVPDYRITGYACACPQPDAPTRPALIVDPFGGTGTTALVAAAYGRTGISVDLSGDYCRLARWRTTDPGERARALLVPKPPPVPDGQGSLFDDMEAS